MGTVEKIFVSFMGLSVLAAVSLYIHILWTEWQLRKESERIEREWREALAELCAAAGIDPDEPEPDAEAWLKPQPPKRPNPEPGTRPNGHTKGSYYSKNDRTPEKENDLSI